MEVEGDVLITVQPEEDPEPEPEPNFIIENPLHVVDNIPIAHLIRVEVEGQAILDPKSMPIYNCLMKAWDYTQICIASTLIVGLCGGVITFMVWFYNPYIFGMPNDD
jgi:hypothetical protein